MPKITITGATGHFGNLVIENLLRQGVPPEQIRASVRDVAKAGRLRGMGIEARRGDFDDPAALKNAFEGTERLLIISTDKIGSRVEQHRRAVQAAKEAGVQRILYTSVVDMQQGDATHPIAIDHRATEQIIRETGIPYTFLRNTFYAEYMLGPLVQALDKGVYVTSVGDGKLGAAARTDLAEAAALALGETGQDNKIFELTYPRPWDFHEAVEVVSKVSGKPLEYRPVSAEELAQMMRQAGLPEQTIQMAVGMNRSLGEGDLSKTTPDLEKLLGHPVTTLEEVTRRLLAR
jgi:NAD(P)H dehydrogenase (quinone)